MDWVGYRALAKLRKTKVQKWNLCHSPGVENECELIGVVDL